MTGKSLFFDTGKFAIRINFQRRAFAEEASDHIILNKREKAPVIGTIDYIEEEIVNTNIEGSGKHNLVEAIKGNNGGYRYLRMFAKYLIGLNFENGKVQVQYPPDIPPNILMDDVLQAALSPLLSKIGGFILHGSCAVRNRAAIAMMGVSGSGKSTTAFNLTRFGFQCYADDAIVVVPEGDRLHVYPLAKEISLRPQAFSLFPEEGVSPDRYRKEGEKYYFKSKKGKKNAVILRHICFVQVSGESETRVTRLNHEQAFEMLSGEKKHFSLTQRGKADFFARIIADKVPEVLCAFLGNNLEHQGKIFNAIISGQRLPEGARVKSLPAHYRGRSEKIDIVKKAWVNPEGAQLPELIPMLADYDHHVFKLALSFFQTYPLAQMQPLLDPTPDIKRCFDESRCSQAGWLRAFEWFKGCKQLVDRYSVPIFEKLVFFWILSAPLIYPFLNRAAAGHPEKLAIIDSAWRKFAQDSTGVGGPSEISLVIDPAKRGSTFSSWKIDTESDCCCIITEEPDSAIMNNREFFNSLLNAKSVTIVPVFRHFPGFVKTSIDFIRQALEYGVKAKISRFTPLCCLSDSDADYLLHASAFQINNNFLASRIQSGMLNQLVAYARPCQLIVDNAESICSNCDLGLYGLCSGSYLKVKGTP